MVAIMVQAGYMVSSNSVREWVKQQTDSELVACFAAARYNGLPALRRYLVIKGLLKHIDLNMFPYPKGDAGAQDATRWYIMFVRRREEYFGNLRQFSEWQEYEEKDEDRKYKGLLKEFCANGSGIELTDWTVVAWVGKIGLYYNFSPEVIDGIYERAKKAQ